jgi:hypothetical protein
MNVGSNEELDRLQAIEVAVVDTYRELMDGSHAGCCYNDLRRLFRIAVPTIRDLCFHLGSDGKEMTKVIINKYHEQ